LRNNKVYIVGTDVTIARMYMNNDWEVVYNPDEAHYIQFTGGADVSPMLYHERKHPRTYNDPRRDDQEAEYFFKYVDEKPLIGICRGGQFLNVMCGGAMYQDVDNHGLYGTHVAEVVDTGELVQVTSTHHQMIRPNLDYNGRVLVTANLATRKEDGVGTNHYAADPLPDTEVVLYDNVLCFQPHPEYVDTEHECQRLFFKLIDQHLKG
jgi:gamma-glutamyl-gamma-aminobutyrate hydrolase PuuD